MAAKRERVYYVGSDQLTTGAKLYHVGWQLLGWSPKINVRRVSTEIPNHSADRNIGEHVGYVHKSSGAIVGPRWINMKPRKGKGVSIK